MLTEKRSKTPIFAYALKQTCPGKASLPTAFSCRGLAVTQNLKQLLFLVLQVPNPSPIYKLGWTTSHGRINLPKLLHRALGPVTGNLNFPLPQQVSNPAPLLVLVHTQLQHSPVPRYMTIRIAAGESWHPKQERRHVEPQVCRAQNFTTPGQQKVLTPLLIPILQSPESLCLSNIFKYFC